MYCTKDVRGNPSKEYIFSRDSASLGYHTSIRLIDLYTLKLTLNLLRMSNNYRLMFVGVRV